MKSKNTFFAPKTTLNCGGKLLDLSEPIIMGILNITPDSFYDGGKYKKESDWLHQTEQMIDAGATIIDIGGMSSRPGATLINPEEELERVIPVIKSIHQHFPNTVLSIDTIRGVVAKAAVEAGAGMVNDISAGKFDPDLFNIVGQLRVPYILMHMQGQPDTMQDKPQYEDIVLEIVDFMAEQLGALKEAGVKDVIIDPGFGFGKTLAQNYQLLAQLATFKMFNLPILVGASRKSMIYKLLGNSPAEALNGTTVVHTIALDKGANILRVHDVREAVEVLKIRGMVGREEEGEGEGADI